jgi:replication factor C subunit 1
LSAFRENNYRLDFKKDNADKSGTFRAVLISGPPGVGKTSAAHLVGESLGYNIVEFNASDTRSKKSLDVWFLGITSKLFNHE